MSAPFRIRRSDAGTKKASTQTSEGLKDYLDRLMKMIPGEVVGLYLIGSGFIPEDQHVGLLAWSIFCLICVVAIRAYGTTDSEKNLPPQWSVVFISSGAFLIWLYTLGGAFEVLGWHEPYIGSLLVLGWTFLIPIFYKGTLD